MVLAVSLPVSPSMIPMELVRVFESKVPADGPPGSPCWTTLLFPEPRSREDPGPVGEVPRCV